MTTLKAWLKQEPQPVVLVCEYPDDREEKRVKMGAHRSRYRDAENACKGATRIEAFDADGDTLRVWEAGDAPLHEAVRAVKSAGDTPNLAGAEQMLCTFGRLLAEAGDAAAGRQTEIMALAFQQQGALMTMMGERLSQLESLIINQHVQREAELAAAEEEILNATPPAAAPDQSTELIMGMLPSIVGNMMNPQTPPNGKTGS